jgi:DNA processing protein
LLASGAAQRRAEAEARRAAELGIRIVGLDAPEYPELLREIHDPPLVLYVRGSLVAGEGSRSVAIVGSRASSAEGCALAHAMARDLAAAGATIVSGLARGIDSAAHGGALAAGGRTVAVLGSGHDRLYPPENAGLAERIAGSGALVSEFPLGTDPRPGNFPRRNRVIAGWGRAVVVAEAAERSGALVTARCALDEGRDVLAVPGHPAHETSAGTNQLIVDGAPLVRSAADVAREVGLGFESVERPDFEVDGILGALRSDAPASIEEIQQRCGRSTSELLTRLTELEMADKVRRLPGPLFIRQ